MPHARPGTRQNNKRRQRPPLLLEAFHDSVQAPSLRLEASLHAEAAVVAEELAAH